METCANCGKRYVKRAHNQIKFCCKECGVEYHNRNKPKRIILADKKCTCSFCGVEFLAKSKNNKYCSRECKLKYRQQNDQYQTYTKTCVFCGNLFTTRYARQKYCCDECSAYAIKCGLNMATEQLCWTCANCYNGCSWATEFEPVPGWDAVATNTYHHGKRGYHIRACPEYIDDRGD